MNRASKILAGILLGIPLLHAQMGMQGKPPTPHKTKKSKDPRDPTVARTQPLAKFDTESEAALKRSGNPGVLRAETALPGRIYEIRIVGAQKTEPEAVLILLKTHIGQFFEPKDTAEDIRRIFKMGLFTDIQAEKDPGPNNSIILTYRLVEKATIFQIKFTGNEDISEEDLTEAIDLKPYQIADMSRIRENAEKIRKLYTDKGFLLAHVAYEVKLTEKSDIQSDEKIKAPDFIDVIFHIEEDAKIRIDQITILGNQALSADTIKEHMRSKEKHPLSFITQWGVFNEDMLDIDGLIIEQLYQEHGYLNVQVAKPRATLSADKTRISIHISLIEGQSYNLGTLEIEGNLLGHSAADLRKEISLNTGDVFNKTKLMQDILSLQEIYRDEGYAYVNITPETRIHEQDLVIDLNLEIEPGPLVHFGRIDIKGNSATMDDVIRRELRIYEGELYSSSLLRLSEQRLNQLGYFETIKLTPKPSATSDKMDIEIEVKEKRLGSVQVGGGYGTGGEGLLFQAQFTQNNLFGRGQSLMGTIQWSAYRRIFELSFMDPYLLYLGNAPLSFSMRAYDTQRYFVDYYRASSGGEISFGYPIGHFLSSLSTKWYQNASSALKPYVPDFENFRFFISYMVERVEIQDSLEGVNYWGWHLNEPRYTSLLRPVLQMDQRNNRLMPSAGYFLEFRTEFASSYLGSTLLEKLESGSNTNNFVRYGGNTRLYYNFDQWFFLKSWVLKLNLDLGLMNTFGVQIVAENFRLGGVQLGAATGLRGYYFQSIGPIVNVAQQYSTQPVRQINIGGNKQFLMNLELEFPIVKPVNLSAVLFFDMGNVYAPGESLFHMGDSGVRERYKSYWDPLGTFYGLGLYSSAGFGMRWLSPFGALRFEWGFPLVKRPHGTPGMPAGDSAMQFLFTIGQSF
jgi:outer membrane protein insertion porin family